MSRNNWDGRTIIKERLEAYVKIEMKENDGNLVDVSKDAGGRIIFLYKNDLDLEKYDYDIQQFS